MAIMKLLLILCFSCVAYGHQVPYTCRRYHSNEKIIVHTCTTSGETVNTNTHSTANADILGPYACTDGSGRRIQAWKCTNKARDVQYEVMVKEMEVKFQIEKQEMKHRFEIEKQQMKHQFEIEKHTCTTDV